MSSPINPDTHSHVAPLIQQKGPQPAHPTPQPTARPLAPSSSADPVQFSSEVQEQQGIQEALRALPDTRQDRVNRLQAAIDSGTYSVAAQDVADKLVRETILNQLP